MIEMDDEDKNNSNIELMLRYTNDQKLLEEIYENYQLEQEMEESLNKLSEKERCIIKLRFYENLSLKEIGNIFNVTGTRIRQIEQRALEKLRCKYKFKSLRNFKY